MLGLLGAGVIGGGAMTETSKPDTVYSKGACKALPTDRTITLDETAGVDPVTGVVRVNATGRTEELAATAGVTAGETLAINHRYFPWGA